MPSGMLSDADRLAALTALGEPITLNIGAGAVTVQAIFTNEFVDVGNIEGAYPVALIRSTDAVSGASVADRGDTATANGTNYTVVGTEPDGQGFTRLILEAV